LVIFVIVEFHALNDMIAEPDAEIGVRLDVAPHCGRAAAHSEPCDGVKPAGKVDFVRCSVPDPRPAVSLPPAGEGQINAIGLGLCRTDSHEPPFVHSSTDGDASKQRDEASSDLPCPWAILAIGRKPAGRHSRIIINTAALPGKWQA